VERRWDLVVVGGGPAGAAAALAARRARPKAAVLLLDRAAFPRDKACGDGIAPQAVAELTALGAAGAVDGFVPVHRLRVEAPSGAAVDRHLDPPDHVVPRAVFDARLIRAACESGVELRRGRVRGVVQCGGRVVLDVAGAREVEASAVVGADGAASVVRRALGQRRPGDADLAVAVRGYARAPGGPPRQLVRFAAPGWPSYAWCFPVGDGTANVGFGLLRSALAGRGRSWLHARLAELIPDATADPDTLRAHHLPLSSAGVTPGRGRVLLAGDAANLINPLTGEGIYYAVVSGRIAGEAAVRAAHPAGSYRRELRALLGAHLRQTRALSRAIRAPRVVEAAVRAAARHDSVSAELVELGLAAGRLGPRSLVRVGAAMMG